MTAAPPLFPVGFPLQIGYMGLYRPDEQPTNHAGRPIDLGMSIVGVRLVAVAEELYEDLPDGMGQAIIGLALTHPEGWEYQVGTLRGSREEGTERFDERGWYAEAELLKAGYVPPALAEAHAEDTHSDAAPVG